MRETKPFYKTSEFWTMVLFQAAGILQVAVGVVKVSEKITTILMAVVASLYVISRGIAKNGVPNDPLLDDDGADLEAVDAEHANEAGVSPDVAAQHGLGDVK